ncbi:hypothetical protein [Sphingomonas sp.]|uniref:hypothetical protein n=1 Tax=Sphingomonas sp. TaxID=28214 RepID=UPI0018301CA3|nr:hypothetical protein [Sphingomonas sp.]MBA3512646.1 hypothetical protein [Sphingomonas sp.]
MNKPLFAITLFLLGTAPAHATGGFVCRTAGSRPIEVSLGFGHVPGSPLILTRLTDNGRQVPVQSAQWWLDKSELRLVLVSPNAMREELVIRARGNRHFYDGSAWRNGRQQWIRCRGD